MAAKKEYSRHYSGFRGVDFSSDPSMVSEHRFPFAVNVWRDYGANDGGATETIPGFRRVVEIGDGKEIYGIHRIGNDVLVHSGNKLYRWYGYPTAIGTESSVTVTLGNPRTSPYFTVAVSSDITRVVDVFIGPYTGFVDPMDAVKITDLCEFDADAHTVSVYDAGAKSGDCLFMEVRKGAEDLGEDIAVRISGTRQEGMRQFFVPLPTAVQISKVTTEGGENVTDLASIDLQAREMVISGTGLSAGDILTVSYFEGTLGMPLYSNMNEQRSCSFVMNNRLYILDGESYIFYDGTSVSRVRDASYIPTTMINIIPSGSNADGGTAKEQRNMLSPRFRNTFRPQIPSEEDTLELPLSEKNIAQIHEVKRDGVVMGAEAYSADLSEGIVTIDVGSFAGSHFFEVVASKEITEIDGVTGGNAVSDVIEKCTMATVFDGRVFLTGNPNYPCHIFYCERNETGYADPSYFGILDYMIEGNDGSAIRSMIAVADKLAVIKGDGAFEGAMYYHSPMSGSDIQPKIYPSERGLFGIYSLGPCISFRDDPVFLSSEGVEAIGRLSVKNERSIEHRSTLIDGKLCKLPLETASFAVWGSYLVLSVDGKMFLADERQAYPGANGETEYEWYYAEEIGVYDGQYPEFRYAKDVPSVLDGETVIWCERCGASASECTCNDEEGHISIPIGTADAVYDEDLYEVYDLRNKVANRTDESGEMTGSVLFDSVIVTANERETSFPIHYAVLPREDGTKTACLLTETGAMTGGAFSPCTVVKEMDGRLYFGTKNGIVCTFNTDKREADGMIPAKYYTFDGRAIFSGLATKQDHCGIPHLCKTTVKRSTVVKMKNLMSYGVKIKVRTNRAPYHDITKISSGIFRFDDVDFSAMSFSAKGQSIFSVKEKEKKWIEKQYFIYSDEFRRPFALFYLSYRYRLSGRYKDKEDS